MHQFKMSTYIYTFISVFQLHHSTTVLNTLQHMLGYFDAWLSKSIGLWVVWTGGFMG